MNLLSRVGLETRGCKHRHCAEGMILNLRINGKSTFQTSSGQVEVILAKALPIFERFWEDILNTGSYTVQPCVRYCRGDCGKEENVLDVTTETTVQHKFVAFLSSAGVCKSSTGRSRGARGLIHYSAVTPYTLSYQ